MGLFALTACSEDVYQEAEMQNEEAGSKYQTNSFNDEGSGGTNPDGIDHLAINYFSPWDIWYNKNPAYYDLQPSYVFNNGDVDGNYSPYTLNVYAWVGLAYFDGTNDGVFNDLYLQSIGSQPQVADMIGNQNLYPNLFTMNGTNPQEVGNLIRVDEPLKFLPLESARIEDKTYQLPMPDSQWSGADPKYANTPAPYNWLQWAPGFNFTQSINNGTMTMDEEFLLRNYGKVFFYEVQVFEGATFVGTYYMYPEIETLGKSANWHEVTDTGGVHQNANLPFGGFPIYYYTNNTMASTQYDPASGGGQGHVCNSFEVVLKAPDMHKYTINGSVTKTLTMDFMQHHQTFWINSALSLRVH